MVIKKDLWFVKVSYNTLKTGVIHIDHADDSLKNDYPFLCKNAENPYQ